MGMATSSSIKEAISDLLASYYCSLFIYEIAAKMWSLDCRGQLYGSALPDARSRLDS
jgi:hypothetical protein